MIDDKIAELLRDSFKVIKKASNPVSPVGLFQKIMGYLKESGVPDSFSKGLGVFICKRAEKSGFNSVVRRMNLDNLEVKYLKFTDINIQKLVEKSLDELKNPVDPDSYGLYRHLRNYVLTS
jgi:hypothetical protein